MAKPLLRVMPEGHSETLKLERIFEMASAHFEKELGEVAGTIKIEISPSHCLRTGYNRRTQTVVFCPGLQTINAGLDSLDVIHHEFFHALLCQKHSRLCDGNERDDVHEAMADVFAHDLIPDDYFGENFYRKADYIRPYRTSWKMSLVRTHHERGLALASQALSQGLSLKEMLGFFDQKVETDVEARILGMEPSTLNRYRLKNGASLEIDFGFSPAWENMNVIWDKSQGLIFTRLSKTKFLITNSEMKKSEKIRVRFFQENREVGGENFYFGPAEILE